MAMSSISNVFVHDLQTGQTSLASVTTGGLLSDGTSGGLIFSPDSQSLFFTSTALDLTSNPPDTSNGPLATYGCPPDNLFVRDLATGTTTLVSATTGGLLSGTIVHVRGPLARRTDGLFRQRRRQPDRRRCRELHEHLRGHRAVRDGRTPPSTVPSSGQHDEHAAVHGEPHRDASARRDGPRTRGRSRADRRERHAGEGSAGRHRAGHHVRPGARSGDGAEHRELPGEPPRPRDPAGRWPSNGRPPGPVDRGHLGGLRRGDATRSP